MEIRSEMTKAKATAEATANAKTNGNTAADRLRAHVAARETQIVDVRCPSDFVYRFKKPSKFGMLFKAGKLPQAAGSIAVEEWAKTGLNIGGDSDETSLTDQQAELIKTAFEVRDRVLELSYDPKFVIGEAQNPNEISTDDVPDDDLAYLYKWVAAGGEMSAMLGTFPQGSQSSPLASASRPKQRETPERDGGD
jgi:hypothetical protein